MQQADEASLSLAEETTMAPVTPSLTVVLRDSEPGAPAAASIAQDTPAKRKLRQAPKATPPKKPRAKASQQAPPVPEQPSCSAGFNTLFKCNTST